MSKSQARTIYMAGAGIAKHTDSLTRMVAYAYFEEWWKYYRGKKR